MKCWFFDFLLNSFTNSPSVQLFLLSNAVIMCDVSALTLKDTYPGYVFFNCSTFKYLPNTDFRYRATSRGFVFSCSLVTKTLKPEMFCLWSCDCGLAAFNVFSEMHVVIYIIKPYIYMYKIVLTCILLQYRDMAFSIRYILVL